MSKVLGGVGLSFKGRELVEGYTTYAPGFIDVHVDTFYAQFVHFARDTSFMT